LSRFLDLSNDTEKSFSQDFLTNRFVVKPLDALCFPFEKTEGYGSKISEKSCFSTISCY